MKSKISATDFDKLKQDVFSYFEKDFNKITPVVPESEHVREINLLKQNIENERFFFVVNLLDFEVEYVHGISKYLGYSEKEFTFRKYWNDLIHPTKQPLKLLARHMYEMLCSGKYELKFMVQRFASLVPLKHRDGHYILTKKTSSVFQYDTKNRLIAYVDEFTIIGDYNGEAFSPRMWFDYDEKDPIAKRELLAKLFDDFVKMKIFAPKELQLARTLSINPDISADEIQAQIGISKASISTYQKRLLKKSREFFKIDFPSYAEAVAYLKKECIL
jgi:hypothetical protein